MTVPYYSTSIGRKVRAASTLGSQDVYWCFRVHDSIVKHVLGAILAVDETKLWDVTSEQMEQIHDRVCEALESIHLCDQNYGADFRLDQVQSRNLEVSQGVDVGLPAPWELRQTDGGILQYRTKEEA